jgi:hypothetical protein
MLPYDGVSAGTLLNKPAGSNRTVGAPKQGRPLNIQPVRSFIRSLPGDSSFCAGAQTSKSNGASSQSLGIVGVFTRIGHQHSRFLGKERFGYRAPAKVRNNPNASVSEAIEQSTGRTLMENMSSNGNDGVCGGMTMSMTHGVCKSQTL